jgi:AcrR family transcriptional regulator
MARPPGYDRQTVIDAAARQFCKTGYAGTSLDDICTATGLGRGSLYAAFGDKHGLFLAALDDYCGRTESEVVTDLSGPDDEALDRLRGYLDELVVRALADEERLGCMAGRFASELGEQDTDAAARVNAAFQVQRDALVGCIEGAQRAGDLDPKAPASDIACLLMTVSRGLDVVLKAGADMDLIEGVTRQSFASLPLTTRARRRLARAVATTG